MPDFEDRHDPFVVVHQGRVGSRILKGRELPQQPVAFPVHRKEPAPEGLAQDEAFIAVAPPEIIDVRHLDSCRRIGIESFPDVSDAFIVNAQILVGAAQFDQILYIGGICYDIAREYRALGNERKALEFLDQAE